MSRRPSSTYRLQLRGGVGLGRARELVAYLDALGIDALYVSPIQAARAGSTHGYDVVDPNRLDPDLGTREDLEALLAELRGRGMGLLVDVVPNHLAASPENPWWWDLLAHGASSPFAPYFDVRTEGPIGLPILDRPLEEALAAGEIRLVEEGGRPLVAIGPMRFPVGEGPAPAPLEEVLSRQAYRFVEWRSAGRTIDYRRFFNVSDLVGVRVEDPAVRDATHRLVLDLLGRPGVAGVRVDHVDGLLDPKGYLDWLRERGPEAYLVVEKILGPDEALPGDWPIDGTTGYDFLNAVLRLFVASDAERRAAFEPIGARARRLVLAEQFGGEFDRLAGRLAGIAGDAADPSALREALFEATIRLDVYRTYVRCEEVRPADRRTIEGALEAARRERPDLDPAAVAALRAVLLLEPPSRAACELVLEWQQLTGPVAAKGVEDTAFYRSARLVALNEVGGDPGWTGGTPSAFHEFLETRRRGWPGAMNATATHDTKRGEDARMRLATLSTMGDEWTRARAAWNRATGGLPDEAEELLVYQAVLGAWPLEDEAGFEERIAAFAVKAAREAKVHTRWRAAHEAHERALVEFAGRAIEAARTRPVVRAFRERVAFHGAVQGLAQLLLKVASPGVPDVYQGTEFWDLSLVDPDNRRPVDFDRRRRALDEFADGPAAPRELLASWRDGRVKLFLAARALAARRRSPDLFVEGESIPLEPIGARADRAIAFLRRRGGEWALAVAPLATPGLVEPEVFPTGEAVWGDTRVDLPRGAPRRWRDEILGGEIEGGQFRMGRLLSEFPVALWRWVE